MPDFNTKSKMIGGDAADAKRHVKLIAGREDAIMNFRVVPESADAKRNRLPVKNLHGGLCDLGPTLARLNAQGYAIFYSLNETDGRGSKTANIAAVRALVLDLDGAPLPSKWLGGIAPHMTIETSTSRFQCIFLIEPTKNLKRAKALSTRLAAVYDGDPSVVDAARVLRLAGCFHWKGEPFLSRIIQTNEFDPHIALADFDAVLPPLPVQTETSDDGALADDDVPDDECLRRMLFSIPVESVQQHERWLQCLQSYHFSTGGRDLEGFLDWSLGDPNYVDHREIIEDRWNSLDCKRSDAIKFGTLKMLVSRFGEPSTIPVDRQAARDDFDGESIDDGDAPSIAPEDAWLNAGLDELELEDDGLHANVGGYGDEDTSRLEQLNGKYCAVWNGGAYRIMFSERHAGGLRWATSSKRDFMDYFENSRIENVNGGRGAPATLPIGKAWQEWPSRKTAQGTCFDTSAAPATIVNGALNLWTGFAVTPYKGHWSRFRAMIRDDLCAGDEAVFEYVIKWVAWKFQNPGLLPEIAIAFRGGKGAGKTTFGEAIANIFGSHAMCTGSVDDIVGRFNAPRETKCFIYADEAVWGGDKRSESELKKLITDKNADYEGKGLPSFQGVNHVGLILGGNDQWVVPATLDERRFCVSTVSTTHFAPPDANESHPNRRYWSAIHHELNSGGREAFLFDMLHIDLGGWHPRVGVPQTAAMGEQKLHGLSGADRWWFERLREGVLPEDTIINDDEETWEKMGVAVRPAKMIEEFASWMHFQNRHTNVSARGLIDTLRKWGVEGGDLKYKHERCWKVPRLDAARKLMADRLGFDPFG